MEHPLNPTGPSNGEVTARYNHKPLIQRWSRDLLAPTPKRALMSAPTSEPPPSDRLVRPRRDGKKPIVITSDTETS